MMESRPAFPHCPDGARVCRRIQEQTRRRVVERRSRVHRAGCCRSRRCRAAPPPSRPAVSGARCRQSCSSKGSILSRARRASRSSACRRRARRPLLYCAWTSSRWRWSKFERPRSPRRSSQFCAISDAALPASAERGVVDRLRERVLHARREAVVQPPPQLHLCPNRASNCRSRSDTQIRTGHAGQGSTAPVGYVFGRNSCRARVPLMPRYVPSRSGAGQIALHGELPVLRVADAEIRVHGKGVGCVIAGDGVESVGQRQRMVRAYSARSGSSRAATAGAMLERRCWYRPTCRSRCHSRRGSTIDDARIGCQASRCAAGSRSCRADERVGITSPLSGPSDCIRSPALPRQSRERYRDSPGGRKVR